MLCQFQTMCPCEHELLNKLPVNGLDCIKIAKDNFAHLPYSIQILLSIIGVAGDGHSPTMINSSLDTCLVLGPTTYSPLIFAM